MTQNLLLHCKGKTSRNVSESIKKNIQKRVSGDKRKTLVPCMRFCSLSAVRARCSFALKRLLFRKAFGLRFSASVISPEPLLFLSATFFLAAFLPDFFFLWAAPAGCEQAVRLLLVDTDRGAARLFILHSLAGSEGAHQSMLNEVWHVVVTQVRWGMCWQSLWHVLIDFCTCLLPHAGLGSVSTSPKWLYIGTVLH